MKQYYYRDKDNVLNSFSFFFIINNNNNFFCGISSECCGRQIVVEQDKESLFYDPQHRDRILHSYEAYFIDTKNVNTNSEGNNANDYNTLLHGIKVTVERHKIITYITQCHHPRIK